MITLIVDRYSELFRLDQLHKELSTHRVFYGFIEGGYDFAPTFKVRP